MSDEQRPSYRCARCQELVQRQVIDQHASHADENGMFDFRVGSMIENQPCGHVFFGPPSESVIPADVPET